MSTVCWIWLCGVEGVKTKTLGPKLGGPAAGFGAGGAAWAAVAGAAQARATSAATIAVSPRVLMSASLLLSLVGAAALADDEPDGKHDLGLAGAPADALIEDVEGGRAHLLDGLADGGQ